MHSRIFEDLIIDELYNKKFFSLFDVYVSGFLVFKILFKHLSHGTCQDGVTEDISGSDFYQGLRYTDDSEAKEILAILKGKESTPGRSSTGQNTRFMITFTDTLHW